MRITIANVMAARYNFLSGDSIQQKEKIMPKVPIRNSSSTVLAQIMLKETDEDHFITLHEIQKALGAYEITADRKTLYADLKDLEIFGIVVEGEPVGKGYHYHVVERPFQLAELKLLVDAIQSSKFITVKKTRELIGKLEQMVSRYEASELQRQFLWQSASGP